MLLINSFVPTHMIWCLNSQSNVIHHNKTLYWTIHLIHTPHVEDFGKVYHMGSVSFQMHLPSVWFLNYIYHRGSKYFTYRRTKLAYLLGIHTPLKEMFPLRIFHRGCVKLKWSWQFVGSLGWLLIYVNGWQLAKMKKSIPDMSLPWNL